MKINNEILFRYFILHCIEEMELASLLSSMEGFTEDEIPGMPGTTVGDAADILKTAEKMFKLTGPAISLITGLMRAAAEQDFVGGDRAKVAEALNVLAPVSGGGFGGDWSKKQVAGVITAAAVILSVLATLAKNKRYHGEWSVDPLFTAAKKTENPGNPENPENPGNPENPENPGNSYGGYSAYQTGGEPLAEVDAVVFIVCLVAVILLLFLLWQYVGGPGQSCQCPRCSPQMGCYAH